MRIIITGAFGFVGSLLARTILERGTFDGAPVDVLVLADRFVRRDDPMVVDAPGSTRVEVVEDDLREAVAVLFAEPVDVVFHLAAAVSGECEADFDLGMATNLAATQALLEAARAQRAAGGPLVRFVFSSSIAVYGSDPALPMPAVISEATKPMPQSSYGTQKYVCEQLITDYTRKGFVDGRPVRLMTVAVRPGKPNAAASSFVSGIIREPLAGVRAVCPVDPAMEVAILSPHRTVEGLVRIAEAPRDVPGGLIGRLPVNLPTLTVSIAQMLATLREVAGDAVADLVTITPDPVIERIVGSWPAHFDDARARSLGLQADADFGEVLRRYLDHARTP